MKAETEGHNLTDWVAAREAADPQRTGPRDPERMLQARSYTTGWLVCAEGPERGRDYRLLPGRCRIGRGYDQDVCIFEDPGISRDGHCAVTYEERDNVFYLEPGKGTLTWFEGEALLEPRQIRTGDRFRIGETTLEFIAYCRGNIRWGSQEGETGDEADTVS